MACVKHFQFFFRNVMYCTGTNHLTIASINLQGCIQHDFYFFQASFTKGNDCKQHMENAEFFIYVPILRLKRISSPLMLFQPVCGFFDSLEFLVQLQNKFPNNYREICLKNFACRCHSYLQNSLQNCDELQLNCFSVAFQPERFRSKPMRQAPLCLRFFFCY